MNAPDRLSAGTGDLAAEIESLRVCITWLHSSVVNIPERHKLPAIAVLEREIAQLQRPARNVFKAMGDDEWLIGPEHEALLYRTQLVGVRAAHRAIAARGKAQVSSAEFAAPGAKQPDAIVRRAIRTTATRWVERDIGCLALANAFACIHVEGGHVVYRPARGAAEVVAE